MARLAATILLKIILYGGAIVSVLYTWLYLHGKPNSPLDMIAQRLNYEQRILGAENDSVDKVSPLLKTNIAVIQEAQRKQMSFFKTLIGKFKYAMLFNFAAFENKGDSAITVGELQLIKKLGIELIFHCETMLCKEKSISVARNISQRYSTEELVILMHGGGNLLSYIGEDFYREEVLDAFPTFQVILFPQSLWPKANREHIDRFITVYSKHEHLIFLYRDRNSYNLGKKIFPEVKCYLVPDMAFQIGAIQRFMEPTHDILWLKRHDMESPEYKIPAMPQKYDVIVQDWWEWKTPQGISRLEDSSLMTANGMMFLQRGRVVITDRLHGHILCVLCGIPHVVIDPINHKISSYMQTWTGGLENILVVHSAEEALDKAIELLQNLDDEIPKTLAFRNSIENPDVVQT